MDVSAVCNLKQKIIKDFNTLKTYLSKGYRKDYSLIMREICVVENPDYFNRAIYEYLITTSYE